MSGGTLLDIMSDGRLVRRRDLACLGVGYKEFRELVAADLIVRDGLGYRSKTSPPTSTLQQVALRYPKGVLCMGAAQTQHGLHDEVERKIHVAVTRREPRNASRMERIPGLALVTWSKDEWFLFGLERVDVGGGMTMLRTDRWRTVADMWCPRRPSDPNLMTQALLTIARTDGRDGLGKVWKNASRLGWGDALRWAAATLGGAMGDGHAPRP